MIKNAIYGVLFYNLVFYITSVFSQSPNLSQYISVYENINESKRIKLKVGNSIVDIKNRITIEFNLDKMKSQEKQNFAIIPRVFLMHDKALLDLPEYALADLDIFPIINPSKEEWSRPQLAITASDTIHQQIVLDLRAKIPELESRQKIEVKEYDQLIISFKEATGSRAYSITIELIETGLDAPKEIAAPLSFIKVGSSDMEIEFGISGIWHFKTRSKLQDYLGFGLTITPNNVDLTELKSAKIGIIPTISIGFGRKNQDLILLGVGFQTVSNKITYFCGLNLAWISRILH